jgi:hypothetical protein
MNEWLTEWGMMMNEWVSDNDDDDWVSEW